jgi:ABC-type uncharacterized transport system permease subunit
MNVLSGVIQATLISATPLLLAALGENVVQKSGVVNVGLEGMLLVGAFAATLGTLYPYNPFTGAVLHNPYLGVLIGALAGMAFALLFAAFAVKLSANQVVVGVVINLLALGLTGTLYRKFFGTTGQFVTTDALPRLPWLGNLTPLSLLAFAAVPGIWWWLYRTRHGLELRASGEQPTAAEASGIRVTRLRMVTLLFGGAMAGVAGAFLSVGDSNTFIPNMSAGRGFIALAIVTAGRWNPYGCLIAALLFGFAESLQYQGQALGLHLPYQLFLALPYIGTLLILAFGSRYSGAPAALGRPYRKT